MAGLVLSGGGVQEDRANVLIVVPCLNEAGALPVLVPLLVRENPGALVVVVDGGSNDGSREIVARLAAQDERVRLLDNPARIQSAAVNLAVRTLGAGEEWLVRVDAHCDYPPDFVGRLLAAAARTGADSVVVPMVTRGAGCFQRAAAAAQNSALGTGGSAHRSALGEGRFVDHGHHALFRLAAFETVGGYDEGFSHNEDAELDHRLGLAGARIWLEPGAAVIYWPRRTAAALWRQYVNYGGGRARTVGKHGMRLKWRQRLPVLVAPLLALAATGLLLMPGSAWFGLLTLPVLGWAGLCLAYGLGLGMQAGSGCAALAGVAAMIMHLGWSVGWWRTRLAGR